MNAKLIRNNSKLPHSELALYIKLYCDRKGSTKTKYQSNLIEATKSWLSLNESEKQKFHTKFNEYEEKCKKQVFLKIKNAKPYMKIKEVRNTDSTNNQSENKEPETNIPDNIPETEPAVSPPLEANSEHDYEKEETNYDPYTTPIEFEEQNENRDEPGNSEEPPQPLLVEPIPPSIKTGHQLFYMLNSAPDESDKIAWKSLQQFEKNRYNRAVLLLKRDYISKYKEYLESLAPKELFDYYYRTRF